MKEFLNKSKVRKIVEFLPLIVLLSLIPINSTSSVVVFSIIGISLFLSIFVVVFYRRNEDRNSLAYKMRIIAEANPDKITPEEEQEILNELKSMTEEDKEIIKVKKL